MAAIEQLKAEHEGILIMLKVLEKYATGLDAGKPMETEDGEAMLDFLRNFADRCHHAKEEEFLFPELEKIGIRRESGPVGVMLHEHDEGRAFIKGMIEALNSYENGDTTARGRFVENSLGYIDLLRAHIDKENGVLFPLAESRLTEKVDLHLNEEFERVEEERIGHGKHEEYHELLDYLSQKYLTVPPAGRHPTEARQTHEEREREAR